MPNDSTVGTLVWKGNLSSFNEANVTVVPNV